MWQGTLLFLPLRFLPSESGNQNKTSQCDRVKGWKEGPRVCRERRTSTQHKADWGALRGEEASLHTEMSRRGNPGTDPRQRVRVWRNRKQSWVALSGHESERGRSARDVRKVCSRHVQEALNVTEGFWAWKQQASWGLERRARSERKGTGLGTGGEWAGCSLTHTCTLETPSKVEKTQWRCPNFPEASAHQAVERHKGPQSNKVTALCKVSYWGMGAW